MPSANHVANGALLQSKISVGSMSQLIRFACSAQKASGSAAACS